MNQTPTVRFPLYPGQNGAGDDRQRRELVYLAYDDDRPIIIMPANTNDHTVDWVRAWVKALLVEQGQP
jgi:hypothetical protein